jgi:hypothetical protein
MGPDSRNAMRGCLTSKVIVGGTISVADEVRLVTPRKK